MRLIFRIITVILVLLLCYCISMAAFPLFFLRYMENKYSISLQGDKSFSWFEPKMKVRNAAFIWNGKVELQKGNFEVSVNPLEKLKSGMWAMKLRGDGARLRFLGDWLGKTGVSEVVTTRLRLALQFSNEGIHDIETVDIVSPDYQLQIHSRSGGEKA